MHYTVNHIACECRMRTDLFQKRFLSGSFLWKSAGQTCGCPQVTNALVNGKVALRARCETIVDGNRGITGMPDEAALWAAWGDVAASLENANHAAGPSAACLAFQLSAGR